MTQKEAAQYARESWPDYSIKLRGSAHIALFLGSEPIAEAGGETWEQALERMHHQMDQIPE